MDTAALEHAAIVQGVSDILALKAYFVAAFTLLMFDYALTFSDEVELAWKQTKSLASVLFLLNRYISLIFSTVILVSYFLPLWTDSICKRYAITEFVYTLLIFTIAEVFLALRVYVLTRKNTYLAIIFVLHLVAQCGLAFYIISQGGNTTNTNGKLPIVLKNPDALQVCILVPPDSVKRFDIAYLALALSFDAFVFVATLITTISAARAHQSKRWLKVIQRDGIIYFLAIFSSTLIWLVMSAQSRPSLKVMNAIPDLIFTAVMINRLYLSLKKAGRAEEPVHLYLGKTEQPIADTELQVIVSTQVMSIIR